MADRLAALALGFALFPAILADRGAAQITRRLSVDSSGREADLGSRAARLATQARLVVFESDATDLVAGDTNGATDVFVKDLVTGAIERVSVDSSGLEADDSSFEPAISPDGRFVAFASDATDLVPGDTNRKSDVFLHDRQSGTTTLASVSSAGSQGNGECETPALSADASSIAFGSSSSNLVSGDTNWVGDVFVRDLVNGTTTRESVGSNGEQGSWESEQPSLSSDGKLLTFTSVSAEFAPNDGNGAYDVFLRDLAGRTTSCLSVDSSGATGDDTSFEAVLSTDGLQVAFVTWADDLVATDTNGRADVLVRDLATGAFERVSLSSTGVQADEDCREPTLSGDGSRVAFSSYASTLAPGDAATRSDVFLRDRPSGRTSLLSLSDGDATADLDSVSPSISDDGARIGFSSVATNLVAGDTNAASDVFLREPPLATWQNYDSGYSGTHGIPTLTASAAPAVGTTIVVSIGNSLGRWTVGVLLAGLQSEHVDSGRGGALLVVPLVIVPIALPPGGATLDLAIPADDRLDGVSAYLQAIEADRGASAGLSFTPGLQLAMGW